MPTLAASWPNNLVPGRINSNIKEQTISPVEGKESPPNTNNDNNNNNNSNLSKDDSYYASILKTVVNDSLNQLIENAEYLTKLDQQVYPTQYIYV